MPNPQHLAILEKSVILENGVELWNQWRKNNESVQPNLSELRLPQPNLSGANLFNARLTWAYLQGANLSRADLGLACFFHADLTGANLTGVHLSSANLTGANLTGAYLSGANLSGANLKRCGGLVRHCAISEDLPRLRTSARRITRNLTIVLENRPGALGEEKEPFKVESSVARRERTLLSPINCPSICGEYPRGLLFGRGAELAVAT